MASLAELKNKVSTVCGEIKLMPVNTIPEGWLSCNGSAISRTTYSKLFAKISTTYGVGDGSTTFTLPAINGSGRFIRGSGGNAAAIGTAQAGANQSHYHDLSVESTAGVAATSNGDGYLRNTTGGTGLGRIASPTTPFLFNGMSSVGGTESRPLNYAMVYCIKY